MNDTRLCARCDQPFSCYKSSKQRFCSKSCGAHVSKNRRHGLTFSNEWQSWRKMRARCLSPNDKETDIVKELREHERDYPELIHGPLCGAAADEIDLLRGQVKRQTKALEWIKANPGAHPRNILAVIDEFSSLSSTEGNRG